MYTSWSSSLEHDRASSRTVIRAPERQYTSLGNCLNRWPKSTYRPYLPRRRQLSARPPHRAVVHVFHDVSDGLAFDTKRKGERTCGDVLTASCHGARNPNHGGVRVRRL